MEFAGRIGNIYGMVAYGYDLRRKDMTGMYDRKTIQAIVSDRHRPNSLGVHGNSRYAADSAALQKDSSIPCFLFEQRSLKATVHCKIQKVNDNVQRLIEWSILGVTTAISGKRQEMDSAIVRPTPTRQEIIIQIYIASISARKRRWREGKQLSRAYAQSAPHQLDIIVDFVAHCGLRH